MLLLLLLFQFQMTHGYDRVDDLQRKSCVCCTTASCWNTIPCSIGSRKTAAAAAPETFSSPPSYFLFRFLLLLSPLLPLYVFFTKFQSQPKSLEGVVVSNRWEGGFFHHVVVPLLRRKLSEISRLYRRRSTTKKHRLFS